jgi:hypothetical protein
MRQRLLNEMYELWMREQVSACLVKLQVRQSDQASDVPPPLTALPEADALQPTPETQPERNRGLFRSLLGLG